jgi:tetratricopeptide (TPR) repeat protein
MSIIDAVRRQALDWLENFQGDHRRLSAASWDIAQRTDAKAEDYRRSLRCAEEANRLAPEKTEYLKTLAVAQYRVGQYEQALDTLVRIENLITAKDKAERGVDQPAPPPSDEEDTDLIPMGFSFSGILTHRKFLAMTYHQLGRTEQARAELQRLRKTMQQIDEHFVKTDEEREEDYRTFLQEAETLIERSTEPAGPESQGPNSEAESNDE